MSSKGGMAIAKGARETWFSGADGNDEFYRFDIFLPGRRCIVCTEEKVLMNRFTIVLAVVTLGNPWALVFAKPDDANSLDELYDMSLEELMEVKVVSASRQVQKVSELSVPVSAITAEDIHYSGVTAIPEIIQFYPGMDVLQVDRNRYSVGVRGMHDVHSEHMQTLIDGRAADSAVFGGAEWFRFPVLMEDIKQIEIVRGPAGAAWGANALTGTVNVITKDPDDCPGWLASTTWNHFGEGYNHTRWSSKLGNWRWRLSLGYGEQETSEDAIADDHFTSRDFSRDWRFDSKVIYRSSEQTKWTTGLGYANNETGDYEFLGLSRGLDSRFEYTRAFAKVDHQFDSGSTGYLQWFTNYDKTHDPSITREWTGLENDVEAQLNLAPTESHRVAIGGHFRWTRVNTDSPRPQDFAFPDEPFSLQSSGLFVTDRWSVTRRLDVESQIRGEWYSETDLDWAGRLAALYGLDEKKDHILRIAGGRGFRTPQVGFDEFSLTRRPHPIVSGAYIMNINTLRDADLENEDTWSLEAGCTSRLSDNLTLKTNAYYQRFNNLIQTFYLSDPLALGRRFTYLDNGKGAHAWGNELELEMGGKSRTVSVWYAYNGFQEEVKGSTLRSYPPARHKVGLRGRYFLDDGWILNANYRYTDTTPYDQSGVAVGSGLPRNAAPPSHRLDVGLTKEFGKSEVMLGVLNVFNKTNDIMQDRGTLAPHRTPGRTFFVRLLYRF